MLPLPKRQSAWETQTVKATVYALKPTATVKEQNERAAKINFWRASAFNRLSKLLGKETSAGMTWWRNPPIVELVKPTVNIVSHETLHAHSDLVINDWLATYAFAEYAQECQRHAKQKMREGFFATPEGDFFKLQKVGRNGKWWSATVTHDGKKLAVNRQDKGITIAPYPPGGGDNPFYFDKWEVPDGGEYLERNPSFAKKVEWARQHNFDESTIMVQQSLNLSDHAKKLEDFFQKPGAGITFLRLVLVEGKPIAQAEWEAISDRHTAHEKKALQKLLLAHQLRKQAGN